MNLVISPKVKAHVLSPNSENPAVYVGTYSKYNEGSIFGAWLDLLTFDTYEEFLSVCRALHYDEPSPELMVQDYQGFYNGRGIVSEWLSRETFDLVRQLADFSAGEIDAIREYWEEVDGKAEPADILAKMVYEGDFSDYASSMADDWIESLVDYGGAVQELARYFDYRQYEQDLRLDYKVTENYVFEA